MPRTTTIIAVLALFALILVFVVPHGSGVTNHLLAGSHQHSSSHHLAVAANDPHENEGDVPGKADHINIEDAAGQQQQQPEEHHHDNHNEEHKQKQQEEEDHHQEQGQQRLLIDTSKFHRTSHFEPKLAFTLKQPLLPADVLQLLSGSRMPHFVPPKGLEKLAAELRKTAESFHSKSSERGEHGDEDDHNKQKQPPPPRPGDEINEQCGEWPEKESGSNVAFAIEFARILRDKFPPEKGGALDGSGLHWFLDEGGLIGSSRAGALRNADDDFDFFLLLPNLHKICRPDSLTCTSDEYNKFIHNFLMVFHNEGMCINKFSPTLSRFKSRGRLMFSFQLNRGQANPESCFEEKKPFAHMHLGIFNERGEVCTNVWIPAHSTHVKDQLHLHDMLPVTRCRAGPVDVPCPQNITGFLTVRNRGEYRKRSSDGSCLIVKKKWGEARKKKQAATLETLDKCGYNSIVDLLPEFKASGFRNC